MDFSALWIKFARKENWVGVLIVSLTVATLFIWGAYTAARALVEKQYERQITDLEKRNTVLERKIVIGDSTIYVLTKTIIDDKQKRLDIQDAKINSLTESLTGVKQKAVTANEYVVTNKESDVRLKRKSHRNNLQSKVIDKIIP